MDNVLTHIDQVKQRDLQEEIPTAEDLQQIANAPISHLVEAAHEVTIHKASQVFNFCAIVNAKSGRCSENCHWCAQSRHFEGQCEIYPLLEAKKIIEAALIAQRSGATRFSLVPRE